MIPSQVWGRVVRVSGEQNKPGTGFLIDYKDCEYLITAKHLCLEDEREEQLTIRHAFSGNGESFSDTFIRCGDLAHPADVAAFRMPMSYTSTDLILPIDSDGIVVSQDVYILGYPYGLFFQVGPTQQLPLVKKGILSGAKVVGGVRLLWVDIDANPGFSGAPVVFHNDKTGRPQVAGVIKSRVLAPVTDPASTDSEPVVGPTGISEATDIKHAIELLQ